MAQRIDVKLGFLCNNYCSFCVQGDKRKRYQPRPLSEVFSILETSYKQGIREVVFTGGEPTVHATLLPSIRHATELGYTRIQIQSNGRRFADKNYLEELIEAGANEFSPAIHGAVAATHDFLTHVPGSFQQVVRGLQYLQQARMPVITNTVITSKNYKELPQLALLLSALGVHQMQFAFIHILGSAEKNQSWIVPKKSEVLPYVRKAIGIAQDAGIFAVTEALPYCFMQGLESHVAESFMPDTAVFDAEVVTEDYAAYRWNEGKQKPEQCGTCALFGVCEGPWKEYLEIYGTEEFVPIEQNEER